MKYFLLILFCFSAFSLSLPAQAQDWDRWEDDHYDNPFDEPEKDERGPYYEEKTRKEDRVRYMDRDKRNDLDPATRDRGYLNDPIRKQLEYR